LPNVLSTPKDVCFEHASALISDCEQYRTKFSFKYSCGLIGAVPYLVAFTLVSQLNGGTRVA
jgi:hypothetical protein